MSWEVSAGGGYTLHGHFCRSDFLQPVRGKAQIAAGDDDAVVFGENDL